MGRECDVSPVVYQASESQTLLSLSLVCDKREAEGEAGVRDRQLLTCVQPRLSRASRRRHHHYNHRWRCRDCSPSLTSSTQAHMVALQELEC